MNYSNDFQGSQTNPDYAAAATRVRAKLGFYGHALSYLVVITFLIVLNLLVSPHHLWFFWPMLGWGIGLACHAGKVFLFAGNIGLEKRMIEKELQQMKGQ